LNVGESAVDDGGPRREYFKLLNAIGSKSELFHGYPCHVVPWKNGKMIATAIVQGGQPPVYFAGAVADFLVLDSVKSPVDIEDTPDFLIRQSLEKVHILQMLA
jgi:hypothetical protein